MNQSICEFWWLFAPSVEIWANQKSTFQAQPNLLSQYATPLRHIFSQLFFNK